MWSLPVEETKEKGKKEEEINFRVDTFISGVSTLVFLGGGIWVCLDYWVYLRLSLQRCY